MDLARLKDLIDLMNRYQLEELEVEEEKSRVRLRKRVERPREMLAAAHGTAPGGALAAPPPVDLDHKEAPRAGEPGVVVSPMVGTFYRAPNPDADPFVEVGDQVEEGKVLCIIEAMKVMNEIKAERAGRVEEIFVATGKSVEYGQPLFRIV